MYIGFAFDLIFACFFPGAAVLGQLRLQGAAVLGVQRRAVRGPTVQMGRAPRRNGTVLFELQDEEQGRPQHAGRPTGAQGAGRHQMQTRQPRHVHQRQVPGQQAQFISGKMTLFFSMRIKRERDAIKLRDLPLDYAFPRLKAIPARAESFLNVYMHGIFAISVSDTERLDRKECAGGEWQSKKVKSKRQFSF